jgi:hypothetical protein
VVNFLTEHERNPIPSPALLERRGQAFRRAVAAFAEANDIPVLSFAGKRDKSRPGVLAESPWPERKIDRVMPQQPGKPGLRQAVADPVADHAHRHRMRPRRPLVLTADFRVGQLLGRDLGRRLRFRHLGHQPSSTFASRFQCPPHQPR